MIDTSKPFYQREPLSADYSFVKQGDEDLCVYASICGAISHLTKVDFIEPWDLQAQCKQRGIGQPTFDDVVRVALEITPHRHRLRHQLPRKIFKKTPANYVPALTICVHTGGIAIVSFELSRSPPPNIDRMARYHMLTLYTRGEGGFGVWDTNGFSGSVTDEELITGIACYPVNGAESPYLVLHPDYDCLLLSKV